MSNELRERPDLLLDGYNATGADIAAYVAVKINGVDDSIALPTADTDAVYGIVRPSSTVTSPATGIKNGKRGSLCAKGRAIMQAGVGGVTAGDRIKPEANTGKGITWGTGKSVIGIAVTTALADGLFEIEMGLGSTGQ